MVITKNGCSETSTCYEVIATGLTEKSAIPVLAIYPNPSKGKFQITVKNAQPTDNFSLEIYNTEGKQVYQKNNAISEIDLSNQPEGVFLVKVLYNGSVLIKKLFIQ